MLVKAKVSQSSFSVVYLFSKTALPNPNPNTATSWVPGFQLPEPVGVILILTITNGETSGSFGNDWLTTVDIEGHWHTA